MSRPSLRLHSKLYRAAALDEALSLARESAGGLALSRRRDGDYYVIEAEEDGVEQAAELLAEVADVALVITVELDRR